MSHPTIQLRVLSGPDKGKELRFKSPCIRLGRDPRKNDFVLTDQYVSACHGQLNCDSGRIIYQDLKSRHGTSITVAVDHLGHSVEKKVELHNLEQITSYQINTNAQLLIGSSLIYLTLVAAQSENDTIEEQAAILSPIILEHRAKGRRDAQNLPEDSAPYHPNHEVLYASYEDIDTPYPSKAFSHRPLHSLDDVDQGYIVENTAPIPKSRLRDQAAQNAQPPNLLPPQPLTSFAREEVDTYPEDGRAKKIFLSSEDTADEQLTFVEDDPESGSFFEELAKISMQDNSQFRGFQTQADTQIADVAFHQDMSLLVPNEARLDVLFRLSNQLNRLHHLDDILELIVDSTFEAFPPAQFFALYRTDRDSQRSENEKDHQLDKYLSRVRDIHKSDGDEVILSESLLEKVAKKREAILFTRDNHANPTVSIIEGEIWSCLCAPLIGQRSLLGVMLVDTRREGALFTPQDLNLFSVLASNAAFALERTQLTEEIVNMFEGFVQASVSAIEARDPTTAGHSERVATYALALAETVNDIHVGTSRDIYFTKDELVELRYAALLHDIGKVGVREDVLNKACRINDDRMSLIRQRFDYIKSDYHLYLTQKFLRELAEQRRSPNDQEMLRIQKEALHFSEELDDIALWLDKIRRVEALSPKDLERLKNIASRKIPLDGSRMVSLLEENETTNLSIVRGTLNDEEWRDMRSHAGLSESYLERIPWSSELKRVPCIAGAHHEKLDGSGYPQGLKEEDLFPQIRILTIADIFDALTAWDRPYRKAISNTKAISILSEEAAAGKLDRELVEIFALKVVPALDQPDLEAHTDTEISHSQPVTIKSSPALSPLTAKTTGHYTLFQQEKFQPHTHTSKVEDTSPDDHPPLQTPRKTYPPQSQPSKTEDKTSTSSSPEEPRPPFESSQNS